MGILGLKDKGQHMKRLFWLGPSREDLKQFPNEVKMKWDMAYILRKCATGITMQKLLAEWEMQN